MLDDIQIRILTEDDLVFVDELVEQAGWNQLRCDWSRILDYEPNGCFAAFRDDRLVGTVTTTSYGTELAWIGMMLVHPEFRRKGIGIALMRHSISYLRDKNVDCIKLDATPEGQFVYEQLGFAVEWTFHRWNLSRSRSSQAFDCNSIKTRDGQLDHMAFGVDRSALLRRLDSASFTISNRNGFGMIRSGRQATYLGPVTASTSDTAKQIVESLMWQSRGPIFWDIPAPNIAAQQLARSLGFQPVRELTRMTLGQMKTSPDLSLQFALAAPETG